MLIIHSQYKSNGDNIADLNQTIPDNDKCDADLSEISIVHNLYLLYIHKNLLIQAIVAKIQYKMAIHYTDILIDMQLKYMNNLWTNMNMDLYWWLNDWCWQNGRWR